MLWTKSWMETRWRFLIGLAVLLCSAAGAVIAYPRVMELMTAVPIHVSGELGRRIRESMELAREYRGYIWSTWFRQNLMQTGTLFAVLLGTGGLFLQPTGGGALFTLSMPVSRNRMHGIRAATGLGELAVLIFASTLIIPLFSPLVRESYGFGVALVHAFCFFVAVSVFFSFASLLSTVFGDPWRPLMIALFVAVVIGIFGTVSRELWRFSIFRVMSAESYFRAGAVPWIGLLISVAASAAMQLLAARIIARRDF